MLKIKDIIFFKRKKETPRQEKGRSMVEMLGVLAVVGILTIGGIYAYRLAMDKYAANQTLNDINRYAFVLSVQMQQNPTIKKLELGEIGDKTTLGYSLDARLHPYYPKFFEIHVGGEEGVPSGVCRQMLNSSWMKPASIFVGIQEYEVDPNICYQSKNVKLIYEFHKDLLDKNEIPEEDKHKNWRCNYDNDCICGICDEKIGLCKSLCPDDAKCAKSYDGTNSWMCCKKENIINDFCCSAVNVLGECCNSSGKCCPSDKPLMDKNGKCYSCDEANNVDVWGVESNCSVCPKRYLAGGYKSGQHNYCSLCGIPGTSVADKPLIFDSAPIVCTSCNYEGSVHQSGIYAPYQCANVCPNREIFNNTRCELKCPANKPLRATNGLCYSCDETSREFMLDVNPTCTTLCSNRKEDNNHCALKSCPTDKPLQDRNGICHSCDEANNVDVWGVEDNCSVCPKRYLAGGYEYAQRHNYCSLCGVPGTTVADKPLIHESETPCYPCDHIQGVWQGGIYSAYKCSAVCPNRELIGAACRVKCPVDQPLRATDSLCYTCEETSKEFMMNANPNCESVCSNRKSDGTYCQIKTCPPDKPLMDKNGVCYACDEPNNVDVKGVEGNCSACPKRYLAGGYARTYCSLCGVAGTSVADKPLIADNMSACFACNHAGIINQSNIYSAYQCANVCPNREMNAGTTQCILQCPEETPLLATNGACYDCDSSASFSIFKGTTTCSYCNNRTIENDLCVRTSCSNSKPLLGPDNECYPCNTPYKIDVSSDKTRCKACVNRTLDGNYCVLNQ